MSAFERLARIPLTIRAPVMVATLMVVVSAIISERVLTRLHEMQEQQLGNVVGTYFDGLSTALIPPVLRQDVWETFDVLDLTRSIFRSVAPLETVVTGRDGRVLAASNPRKVPALSELPSEYSGSRAGVGIKIDWDASTGFGVRQLLYQQKTIGAIHASFDISHLIAERREVLNTLLATNTALASVFAVVGYVLARRMVKPVTTLAAHMRSGAAGTPRTIGREEFPYRSGELADLFHGFNDLVEAERQRSALSQRLAQEEKLASLGRLASSMAHEINNPLGGLFNSIDTLRRHGSNEGVREATLSLLERGLGGIRDVVRATLTTYRPDKATQSLKLSDLEDVRLLAGPVISGRHQTLDWLGAPTDLEIATLPGPTIRQALLNLVLNASAASGDRGRVVVKIGLEDGGSLLSIAVSDSGPGLGDAAIDVLTSQDPWSAAQAAGGLGLWMVRRMLDDVGGWVDVQGRDGSRTMITLRLPILARGEEVHHAA